MKKRFSLCKKVGVFLLTAVMCTSQLNVQAEKKYDFETEYQVIAGANGYFIAKNQKGEYGLLDREGEKAVGFDYSEMEFPKDTMQYQYIKVKQNKNWGIVDYDENTLVPLNFEKVSEYSNGNTIAAGYNGNTTYLYDLKGKEQKKQLTGSGSYSVISDTVFWGKEDIRNEKDNTLVKLEENSLLDKKKNSLAVKVGDTHYAVQKYTTQLTGNLETDQNIEVYEKDEKTQDILPEEEWVKDKDSTVKGSLKLIKAVSDKNIIADMQMDDGFKVIYNIEDGQSTSKYKSKKDLTIVIDPGHGGIQSGTQRGTVEEKTLNLKIAQYLKEALEKYKGVTVSLTRDGDYDVSLTDRTQYSVDKNADLMVSIHNNATGDCAAYDSGCTVLAAKDGYKQELADEEQKLACNILNELEALGIENQGILLRDSEANEKYENGELADYYAIIRGGVLKDIPTVLVEHAFVDDDSDFENYLSSDAKLKVLAEADAKGIARYYQLTTEDGKKAESPLENYKEKIVHIVDGNSAHNKISYKTYYPSSQKDNKETDSGTDKITTNNGQTEQTTESITAQGKKDATEKVKRTEKSSEQTLDTTANTSFKEVTHSPKKENIRVDSIILFVMIVALVAALILLKILLGKRKK